MPTITAPTAEQILDRINGLIANGYGPEHLAAAVLVAADPTFHGATVDAIADFDDDLDGDPVGLADCARELIADGVLLEGPDGQLAIEPYEDL